MHDYPGLKSLKNEEKASFQPTYTDLEGCSLEHEMTEGNANQDKLQDTKIVPEASKVVDDSIHTLRKQAEDILSFAEACRANIAEINTRASEAGKEIEEDLKAIDGFRTQAEKNASAVCAEKDRFAEYLKAAEDARRAADEHATYAFQAKQNSEGHAKAVSSFKGTAEAELNAISAHKQKADELTLALTRAKTDTDADSKTINERRKEVDRSADELMQTAVEAASHLEKIENLRNQAAASQKATEQACSDADQNRQKAKDANQSAEQASSQAIALLAKIKEAHKSITETAKAVSDILQKSTEDKNRISEVLNALESSNEAAADYEKQIAVSSEEIAGLKEKIESLLPGAASASLASAFASQKQRFTNPKKIWLRTFICCIGGLIIVALPSFFTAVFADPSTYKWQDVWRCLILRLPVVVPLVWLAIYAGRNYILSLRLEEDYAYKEAVSTAFEGYKREMEQITTEAAGDEKPIVTLCVNVLTAIAERPGRIYEGTQKDITPQNEMLDYARKQISES